MTGEFNPEDSEFYQMLIGQVKRSERPERKQEEDVLRMPIGVLTKWMQIPGWPIYDVGEGHLMLCDDCAAEYENKKIVSIGNADYGCDRCGAAYTKPEMPPSNYDEILEKLVHPYLLKEEAAIKAGCVTRVIDEECAAVGLLVLIVLAHLLKGDPYMETQEIVHQLSHFCLRYGWWLRDQQKNDG